MIVCSKKRIIFVVGEEVFYKKNKKEVKLS